MISYILGIFAQALTMAFMVGVVGISAEAGAFGCVVGSIAFTGLWINYKLGRG